ncbi:LOW QUALITY PROTEIN: uncharacterized protein C2orf92 homolog [Balaenoptera ricei]|uniref:LOW QUALITY PROTEIN: uncharacterized protein C2orf92 homolog n=1 Tax=Balaenoptera ricei TaxID=2746895 RepID=UPI0028BE1BF1|nr:LOW QUALITY PROTEIN: uncharacterized protein C2orf92 homolog [Balaenoptera ricei]
MTSGYPQQKSLRDADFALSSNKREEHLVKLFGRFSTTAPPGKPRDSRFEQAELRIPNFDLGHLKLSSLRSRKKKNEMNKQSMRASFIPSGANVDGNSESEFFLGSMDRISNNGHIAEEKRDKESSLFDRDVSDEQLTTVNKGTLQEAISPDVPSRSMPRAQLLHFLQRDISIAAVSVAGIFTATVLLLLALVTDIRKKQPLSPPANMAYNIFIMNGKTWWQKSQEKKTRKHAGKQEQVKLHASV